MKAPARSARVRGVLRPLVFLAFWVLLAEAGGARRPNVVVVFTDDHGTVDAGCYGSDDIKTPHLDALAGRGTRFTQFYAAAPVCSPSRAGLLTGRYPVRAGVPGNAGSAKGQGGLPPEETTLAEVFRGAGYATAHIGKWHLGYTAETMPNAQGFDRSFGHMGGCIDNYSHFFYWAGPNRHDLHRDGEEVYHDGEFFPDLMVEEAARFIDTHRDKPFFLYFALNVPHYPYQGDTEWLLDYRERGVAHPRDLYGAFVSTLDARLGQLLGHLRDAGLEEDTIVVFQSDHGHSTEERAHHGGGSSGPYRGAKFSLFEGGIRVPAVISWPGHLPQGNSSDALAHGCDWLPTLAALASIELPENLDLDGKNLAPHLRGEAGSPHGVVHWQVGTGKNAQWAVRKGPWKLIGNPRDTGNDPPDPKPGPLFLSNLETDPGETRDLSAANPGIVAELQNLRDEWTAAPRASEK